MKLNRVDGSSPTPLLSAAQWESARVRLRLSPQQSRIVANLLKGRRDKQIAAAMKLSQSTVRTHLRQIFSRAKVSDRVELLLLVLLTAVSVS